MKHSCPNLSVIVCFFLLFISAVIGECFPGKDCVSQQICTGNISVCELGTYCAGNETEAILCKPGYYCPSSSEQLICPEGHWCSSASIAPKECRPLSSCAEGSFKEKWLLLLLILGIFFVALIIFKTLVVKRNSTLVEQVTKHATENGYTMHEISEMSSPSARFNIQFIDLCASIGKQEKVLLSHVSGSFQSGRLTAVMGPSGTGKTSLLRVIMGKIPVSSGTVIVNGVKDKIQNYSHLVGFVPQDDIMLKELTVHDLLAHSANLRLPSNWGAKRKELHIDGVLAILGIGHIKHSIVGDELTRSISGGERKRVNIAMELVANPSILFLDEPTTGLDSTSAQQVVNHLKSISNSGVTVVAVVHQPRYEILELFDDILLMKQGGQVAYCGEAKKVISHFQHHGYVFPDPPYNPADYLLDIVSGVVPSSSSNSIIHNETPRNVDTGSQVDYKQQESALRLFVKHLYYYLKQCAVIQKRQMNRLFIEIVYQLIPGISMGASAMAYELYLPPVPQSIAERCPDIIRDKCLTQGLAGDNILVGLFFLIMVTGAASSITANMVFGAEKPVFYREKSWGVSIAAFFISRNLYELWNILRNTFIFLAFYLLFSSPQGTVAMWFGAMFFLQWAIYGMGYCISLLMNIQSSLVFSPILVMAFSVTSGLSPTLIDIKGIVPLEIIWFLSFNRWASEALFITGTSNWSYLSVRNTITNLGYNPDNYSVDLLMLFVIGLLWRIGAFLALRFKKG